MRINNSNIVFNKLLKEQVSGNYEVATYKGITLKTLFYLLMTIVGAVGGFALAYYLPSAYLNLILVASFTTFIFAMISFFSYRACKVTGTIYCLLEGVLVGLISLVAAYLLEGAVTIALLSTVAVFAVVAVLFVSNIVKVNSKFTKFLIIFAISFLLSQLLFWIAQVIFGFEASFGITILVSAITVFLATLYLFFDLEKIRQVVEGGYPKEMEWYASFGLAFTLIWLYVEILRLVIIIFGNRN